MEFFCAMMFVGILASSIAITAPETVIGDTTTPQQETDLTTPRQETDLTTPRQEIDPNTSEEETDTTTPQEGTDTTTPQEGTDTTTPQEDTDATTPHDTTTPQEDTDATTPQEGTDTTTPQEDTDTTTPQEETDTTTPQEGTDPSTTDPISVGPSDNSKTLSNAELAGVLTAVCFGFVVIVITIVIACLRDRRKFLNVDLLDENGTKAEILVDAKNSPPASRVGEVNEQYSDPSLPIYACVHQQQDVVQLTQNQDDPAPTTDNIPMVTNEYCSTSHLPSPMHPSSMHPSPTHLRMDETKPVDDIPVLTNECYSTSCHPSPTHPQMNETLPADDIPVLTNECYSTSHLLHSHVHQQQDMQLTQNQDINADDIPIVTNECYSTSRLPSPTRPCVHQQQDMQFTQNLTTDAISTVTNECYSTSRLPSPTCPRVHQQQDMQLTQNQAYVTSEDIPTSVECYSVTTPSSYSDHVYASLNTTHTNLQQLIGDYDYVIPNIHS